MSVGVLVDHHVKSGERDAVRAIWEQLLRPAIEPNPGHLAYAYMYDEDSDVIRAFHQYADEEAASSFLTTAASTAYVAAAGHLLRGPPKVIRTRVIWTNAPPK